MVSALVAALALAGAPGTPVTCNPALTDMGVTHLSASPVTVELAGKVCGGLLYASASSSERAAIRRLNPHVSLLQWEGIGLLVALHEGEHVALGSRDECVVERAAMAKLPQLVAEVLPRADRAGALALATANDAALPPSYHGC